MRILWIIGGGTSVALGVIGIVLPLVPTVPFLLLAAFCFARSSPRLHDWLVEHPRLGPPIRDWRSSGAIGRGAKRMATLSVAAAFAISLLMGVAPWALAVQAGTLACVLTFIWTRPHGAEDRATEIGGVVDRGYVAHHRGEGPPV